MGRRGRGAGLRRSAADDQGEGPVEILLLHSQRHRHQVLRPRKSSGTRPLLPLEG